MKKYIKIITLLLAVLFINWTQAHGKEIKQNLEGEVLAYIELPEYPSGDERNPVIKITSKILYNKLVKYIGRRPLIESRQKRIPEKRELALKAKGILIHLMDIDDPSKYIQTISVEDNLIKVEDDNKVQEYLKDTKHLDALIFTLGIKQGIFQLPEENK